jgi:peptidoglycan LD-endopeptidase CwlK
MAFEMKLSAQDLAKLKNVHPDLKRIIEGVAKNYTFSFCVLEGDRSKAAQVKNLAKGVSTTLRSRHVIANNACGLACAVDLAPLLPDGKSIPWKQWALFSQLNTLMMAVAKDIDVPLEWGGNWKTFKDGAHWQLPWKQYP